MSINEGPLRRILKNKQSRIGAAIIIVGYTLTLISFTSTEIFDYFRTENTLELVVKVSAVITLIIGVGYFLLGYLEGNKVNNLASDTIEEKELEKIRYEFRQHLDEMLHTRERNQYQMEEQFEKIRAIIESQSEIRLDEKQRVEIFDALKEAFSKNINEDFFRQLNENISIELTKEKRGRLELLLKEFSSIKSRLYREIETLGRKANVNLVIGSLTTIVALFGLSIFVFQNTTEFKDLTSILYHYIPRISLIIFIEVFAYFFLRLYKLNLNDIKYFQNELTTVELKLASITTAINFGKDIDISFITAELSKTERNFILKKGESTVEIEKSKIEKNDFKDILKSLTEAVKNQK